MNSVIAKIGGWAQFGLQLLSGFAANGPVHGWAAWLATIGSLVAAVGIHAASNVGQVQQQPTASSTPIAQPNGNAVHVAQ